MERISFPQFSLLFIFDRSFLGSISASLLSVDTMNRKLHLLLYDKTDNIRVASWRDGSINPSEVAGR